LLLLAVTAGGCKDVSESDESTLFVAGVMTRMLHKFGHFAAAYPLAVLLS
jgi:hypothetical protein